VKKASKQWHHKYSLVIVLIYEFLLKLKPKFCPIHFFSFTNVCSDNVASVATFEAILFKTLDAAGLVKQKMPLGTFS